MELQKLSSMLTNLSVWTNIAPYYGTYDDWSVLLEQLSYETNKFWQENEYQFLKLDYDLFQDYRELKFYAEEFLLSKPDQSFMIDLEFDLYDNFENICKFFEKANILKTDRLNSIAFTCSFELARFLNDRFYETISNWNLEKFQSVSFKTFNFEVTYFEDVFGLILPAAKDTISFEECTFPPRTLSKVHSLWYNCKHIIELTCSVQDPEDGNEFEKHDYKFETIGMNTIELVGNKSMIKKLKRIINARYESGMYKNLKQLNVCPNYLNCKEIMDYLIERIPEGWEINEKYEIFKW